jgi:L-alanine-DL-glutamate epimerase-like enolase superfamily enzyme
MARLAVEPVRLALRSPLRAAWGELRERDLLRVRLSFAPGDWGEGEAAPLEPYDRVPLAAVRAALDAYAAVLAGAGPDADPHELLAACAAERPLPQALAAIDLALWDRAARRAGTRLADLLAPGAPEAVPVNATIAAEDRAGAATAAERAALDGFRCVKVKVGVGDDAGRLAAVRAAVGPDVAIRADANGAWRTPEEALANLRALAPAGLELCEEPVHGVARMLAVRAASPVPIALDETAAEPGAAGSGAADAICLKISRCGGISGLLAQAALARAMGMEVYLASTYDGPLGIAAAVHAAAVIEPDRPCGLATLSLFDRPDPLPPRGGRLSLPPGPGLGDGLVDWYA